MNQTGAKLVPNLANGPSHTRDLHLIQTEQADAEFSRERLLSDDEIPSPLRALVRMARDWFANLEQAPLAVVLGSGLGGLADAIIDPIAVGYHQIPGLARSTASGHRGEFLLGRLENMPIIAMAGRLHAYEGHSIEALTRPMAIMAAMRPRAVVVSCAAGGLNPRYETGDLVIIDEHLSLLHGKIGLGGVPLGEPHSLHRSGRPTCDESLAVLAEQTAWKADFRLHRGSYLAVTGPNYETRAECRMMRSWGFDLIGMSTVPEVVLASSAGLPTLAIGIVTNMAVPDAAQTASHEDVLAVSSAAGDRLEQIVRAIARDNISTFAPAGCPSETTT
ncbi:purine-nucleoside phosphorylase [Neorhodopirellula pilleata]|uniref:purine-nucleoside phosphorylase n=1 Tax=Neorhodopirellula pilleata TaxID=2714738 RepID=UPI001E2BC9F6|nr:purine-nucleoside phosphorylase [Neorhodopirellula pilleata]